MMSKRRILNFSSLDDALEDVDGLMAGHATLGGWSLGQILNHLATAIRVSSRARPAPAAPPISDEFRRTFFQQRRFPDGIQAPHPRLIPEADADPVTESVALRDAINRWDAATGPFAPHPLLGSLSKDEWTQFHCIHCAHHLGFVVPTARLQGRSHPGLTTLELDEDR